MDPRIKLCAIAAASAAATALGQSTDPVTLYGRVYATFETVEAKGQLGTPNAAGACAPPTCAREVATRNRVSDQSSYLGVRGTEKLGGGLSAFFQLETQFKPDQNDTTFANRNSGVGLRGGFGSLLIGRWDTPFKWANGEIDPTSDLTIGAFTTALQGSGVAGIQGQFDRRDQNVVQYWSPPWGGLSLRASYSANEGKTDTANPRSQGASLTWSSKAVFVGYAYHELRDQPYGIYTNVAPVLPAALANGTITVGKQTANSVFGSFQAGAFKFGADYQEFKRTGPVLPASPGASTVVGFEKQKAWLANVVWTLGANQFMYEYLEMKGGTQQAADPAYTPPSAKCSVNMVGWQYNFSKRTFLLAQYVHIDNNATAWCTVGQVPLAITAGQDPRGLSLGLRHVF